jgi:hypothetical protein
MTDKLRIKIARWQHSSGWVEGDEIVFVCDKEKAAVACNQGCQMVCFQTKSPKLGKFWRALNCKMSIYLMPIWNILRTFGIFYSHLVHFVFIWYILFRFLVSCNKKNLATLLVTTRRPEEVSFVKRSTAITKKYLFGWPARRKIQPFVEAPRGEFDHQVLCRIGVK